MNNRNMYCYRIVYAVEGSLGFGAGTYYTRDKATTREWVKSVTDELRTDHNNTVLIINWNRLPDSEMWDEGMQLTSELIN